MTLDQEIDWWRNQSNTAATKEAAIVAFGIYAGLTLANGDHMNREKQLEVMLATANELLRSTSAICDRKGASTNWEAFSGQVRRALSEQHEFMHPEQYTSPRAG